jgi:hypothetical protein
MQAADLWDLDHLAKRGRLDRSADRRILFERQMRTAPFVVCKILLQGLAQPSLTEDKDVVQTLPSVRGECSATLNRHQTRTRLCIAAHTIHNNGGFVDCLRLPEDLTAVPLFLRIRLVLADRR